MSREMPPTRRGYVPWEVVSALQKAVRRSDPDAALYWAAELFQSGYAAWAWKRLMVIMTEDVGPSMPPGSVADVKALREIAEDATKKDPKHNKAGEFFSYSHALMILIKSPKTRLADNAFMQHTTDHVERREIPDEAHDVHTRKGKQMGRGWDYFVEESGRLIDPDEAAQSRGYDSMEHEMQSLSDEYLRDWLDKLNDRNGENPFQQVTEDSEGEPHAGKGVKTHYVQRPLGIPMQGEPKSETPDEQEETDE